MRPHRAESLTAVPPLPINLNRQPLCGVPRQATLSPDNFSQMAPKGKAVMLLVGVESA